MDFKSSNSIKQESVLVLQLQPVDAAAGEMVRENDANIVDLKNRL
jgi:hypothetical protein